MSANAASVVLVLGSAETIAERTPADEAPAAASQGGRRTLPVEILTRICVLSGNPSLALVSRKFNAVTRSTHYRARWLLQTYGADAALALAWNHGLLHVGVDGRAGCSCSRDASREVAAELHDSNQPAQTRWRALCRAVRGIGRGLGPAVPAGQPELVAHERGDYADLDAAGDTARNSAASPMLALPLAGSTASASAEQLSASAGAVADSGRAWGQSPRCPLERKQVQLVACLLHHGARVQSFNHMALCMAAQYGHLHLVALIMSFGGDPEAVLGRKRLLQHPTAMKDTYRFLRGKGVRWPLGEFRRKRIKDVILQQKFLGLLPGHLPDLSLAAMLISATAAAASAGAAAENATVIDVDDASASGEIPPQPPQPPNQAQTVDAPPAAPLVIPENIDLNQPDTLFELGGAQLFSEIEWEYDADVVQSLFYQAVLRRHVPLARMLLGLDTPLASSESATFSAIRSGTVRTAARTSTRDDQNTRLKRLSRKTISAALGCALSHNHLDVAEMLINEGGASTTIEILQEVMARAGLWRLVLGLRHRFSRHLVIAVSGLSDLDFRRISSHLFKSCCEIGSLGAVREVLRRSAVVDNLAEVLNSWDGLPLYASVYSGNTEVSSYLARLPETDVGLFTGNKIGFCAGLMAAETVAIVMFGSLVVVWAYWAVRSVQSSAVFDGPDDQGVSLAQLTGIALPSGIAISVMYHLVPLHRMVLGIWAVLAEKRRRRLAARNAAQE
nr:hypothetical protein HK105_007119 [Polyrhizophydium stewartii]